jgi:hypothetical protein
MAMVPVSLELGCNFRANYLSKPPLNKWTFAELFQTKKLGTTGESGKKPAGIPDFSRRDHKI